MRQSTVELKKQLKELDALVSELDISQGLKKIPEEGEDDIMTMSQIDLNEVRSSASRDESFTMREPSEGLPSPSKSEGSMSVHSKGLMSSLRRSRISIVIDNFTRTPSMLLDAQDTLFADEVRKKLISHSQISWTLQPIKKSKYNETDFRIWRQEILPSLTGYQKCDREKKLGLFIGKFVPSKFRKRVWPKVKLTTPHMTL
jgi:hypothetical protein